jgi:hypothetical protein
MKAWLAKLRVSTELDSSEVSRTQSSIVGAEAEEVGRFAASVKSLDRRLKAERVLSEVPSDLHASIMRAVRKALTPERRELSPWLLRWLPASGVALLAAIGLWWHTSQPVTVEPVAAPLASVVELPPSAPQRASSAILSPLSQEMEYLKRDFEGAVRFLAASVP